MDQNSNTKEVKEAAKDRAYQEIHNLAMAEAYLAVADLLPQRQFAMRIKMDPGKLNTLIAKLQKQEQPQTTA